MTGAATAGHGLLADIGSLTRLQPFLVVAPHPDDETLGCAGLIAQAWRLGLEPAVVVLTDGCASHDAPGWTRGRLARVRSGELAQAIGRMGLPGERLHQLGLADGDLQSNDATLAALRPVVAATGARTLFVTDPGDSHPDHRAAFRLAVRLVAEGAVDALVTYPVGQRFEGGALDRFEQLGLRPDELARKAAAIACHQSQLGQILPDGTGFGLDDDALESFRQPFELFRPVHGLAACLPPDPPAHFDALFARTPDPWGYETSPYERQRHATTIAALGGRRFRRGWEAGAAAGILSERLLPLVDTLVATDASPLAVEHARARLAGRADVRCLALPDAAPEGEFDLILQSDMLYYLGLDGVIRTARLSGERLAPGGLLVVASWLGETEASLTGLEAAEAFAACASPRLEILTQETHPGFRLDIYRGVRA